ncbi:4-hydroxybenzoate octaprenyltransferase [Ferruginivarius sediminum]|uniref:4-hydroxybenzoate octaprenyltransferase n=1 Tax=Ferruginivarius sediminum TaxID=2661937 RepID=A0A369TBT7_9PROT|nr:4-hydroxybenzoate octaprenyltransferase [Ferruginivarius sediminum]RDD61865.1 4-hydroxybenzoate octaprenyltransferase [Ferruginivarius sediminum]
MNANPETARPGRSDIPTGSWIDRYAAPGTRPFLRLARLDRPIGWWLLMWPCWFGAGLAAAAASELPSPYLLVLFLIGAVAMRGAGCTYNDIVDRNIDTKVARTATRPIASGAVSVRQAWMLLVGLCLIGLAVLVQLGTTAIIVGLAALLLVAAYPFMKRITYWPQAWLGLTFNWGALVGWAAATGELGWPALWLYIGGIAWTLGYDTIYAHQDKEDDALIGVKSSALKLGDKTQPALVAFYIVAVGCWTAAGAITPVHWTYLLGVGAVAVHFAWQALTLDINDHRDCLAKFKSNRFIGALLFLGILIAGATG